MRFKLDKNLKTHNIMSKSILVLALFGLFSLILVNSVSASSPSYDFTDLTDEKLLNGENDVGDLLFIYEDYITEIHTLTKITNITLQRFDTILWQSSKSIKIIPPIGVEQILVNGNSYKISNQGIYTIQSITNTSEFSTITSSIEDENRINLTVLDQPNGLELDFDPKTFLLNDEESVEVNIEVDDDIEPGSYDFTYQISVADEIVNVTKSFIVLENINWTINTSTLTNQTYKTGDSVFFGYVELENIGNKNVEITLSKTGNKSYMLGIPQPQTLYKKSVLRLNFQLQVPTVEVPDEYDIELIIEGGDIIETIPFTITIQDSLKPNIESISFSTDKVYKENDLTVIATDNNDVTRVELTYDGQTIKLVKDGNKFTIQQKFIKLSRYVMNFCAYDEINNSVCEIVNKTFIKDNVVSFDDPSLELPTKKITKYSKIHLLDINKTIPEGVVIQLVELNIVGGSGNYSPTVRIIDQDGTVKTFSQYENQVKITDVGEVFLEVRSDVVSDYNGILRIILPDYVEEVEDISFKVGFKDYDVPEDFTLPWFDDRTVICEVEDTGDLETSQYTCEMNFPIDVAKEDLSFPTTAREKSKLDTDVEVVRDELSKSKGRSATIITLLIMILIVVVGGTYFYINVFPYVRIKAKVKDR